MNAEARSIIERPKGSSSGLGKLRLIHKGRNRISIVGAHTNSPEAYALREWLEERIDVVRYEQRARPDAFDAVWDDGAAIPGRFLRSLRDKIHALNRIHAEPFDITPAHSLRGRVRLRVTGIGERQLATLTMLAAGLPGVKHTKHLPGGRTMLVVYDPEQASEYGIVKALLESDPAEWAREWHKPSEIRLGRRAVWHRRSSSVRYAGGVFSSSRHGNYPEHAALLWSEYRGAGRW